MPSALRSLVLEWRVVANVFNIFVGAGVLALPFAVASSGWLGLALLLSVSCMANYTVRGLSEVAMHTGFDGYGQMASATFGVRGRKLVNLLLLVDIGSLLCVLLLLIGENLYLIMPATASQASWTVLAGLGVLPTMFVDLSGISWLSLFGDCCQLLLFGAMVSNAGCGATSGAVGCGTVVAERGITLSAGLYIYAWAGHPVVPSIVGGSREEQERFGGVANAACALIFGWLALFGGVPAPAPPRCSDSSSSSARTAWPRAATAAAAAARSRRRTPRRGTGARTSSSSTSPSALASPTPMTRPPASSPPCRRWRRSCASRSSRWRRRRRTSPASAAGARCGSLESRTRCAYDAAPPRLTRGAHATRLPRSRPPPSACLPALHTRHANLHYLLL